MLDNLIMDIDIKEEVYKCSKCGLCQSVCPIYLATKNEMYLSRGRYIVLNNSYNYNKKLSTKFIKDLDLCLNCNLCKSFCPSNIDAREIFTLLKSQNNYKYSFLPFSIIFLFILLTYNIRKKNIQVKREKKQSKNLNKENILYFQGCINKYVNPSDKNATLNILEKLGYRVVKISSLCCGLPYLSDGDLKSFQHNSNKIIDSVSSDIKYIVCSCDSCYETLKRIPELKEKLIRFDDLLKLNNFVLTSNNSYVYHKPLIRNDECYLPKEIKILNKKGNCSLMENFILLKHRKLADKLFKDVFYKKQDIENKTIITSCLLSKFGLEYLIKKMKIKTKVYSYSEYIYSDSMRKDNIYN